MHIFFSVGEPSGDHHAAHLIEELRRQNPNVRVSGFGGPVMRGVNCEIIFELTTMAVMGLVRVLPLLWKFYKLVQLAGQHLKDERPDAVVLVDFPGFNWYIARKAKKLNIPVFYYMPPQLWAWAPWRLHKVRKFVDVVLSGLTFETEWYKKRGINAKYVGHPFFDEVAEHQLDNKFCEAKKNNTNEKSPQKIVGVLPGSRSMEIMRNWPLMIDMMKDLSQRQPNTRFLVACYKPKLEAMCQELYQQSGATLPIEFHVGKTSEIIEVAECCLMVSGSVSLELLARNTPAVVVYRIDHWVRPFAKVFVRTPFISLPNLLAGHELYPEKVIFHKVEQQSRQLTDRLDEWIQDESKLKDTVNEITDLSAQVAQTGASQRTAIAILEELGSSSNTTASSQLTAKAA